jgi:uncharacterized protein
MARIFLLLAIVLGIFWWLRDRAGTRQTAEKQEPPPRRTGAGDENIEPMVQCAHCGVHLPRGDAIAGTACITAAVAICQTCPARAITARVHGGAGVGLVPSERLARGRSLAPAGAARIPLALLRYFCWTRGRRCAAGRLCLAAARTRRRRRDVFNVANAHGLGHAGRAALSGHRPRHAVRYVVARHFTCACACRCCRSVLLAAIYAALGHFGSQAKGWR